MERAIAYCRVSDPRQVRDEGSLARQEQEAVHHAERNNYELIRTFIERGESAKTDNRTELKLMLAFARTAKIQILIIPKIDRLARNSFDYLSLKIALSRFGTRIESVGENIEDTPVGRFLETVLSGTAQLDNEIRAERSRNGMIDAFKSGKWVWRAPYGYEFKDGDLIPKESEATIVRTAFRLSRSLSFTQVFEEARKLGFSRQKAQLNRILHNPVYAGRMRAFGLEVEGAFEPLVQLNDLHEYRSHKAYERNNPDFPLKNLCHCCGAFTASWSRGRTSLFGYYRCRQCGRNFSKRKLEQAFTRYLDEYALTPWHFDELSKSLQTQFRDRSEALLAQRKREEREIKRCRDLQLSLALKNASGTIPDDIAAEQIGSLRQREHELRRRTQPSDVPVGRLLALAKYMLLSPGEFWRLADHSARIRFQQFIFPEGIRLTRKMTFGTKKMRLLEPAKLLLEPRVFDLVDQRDKTLNQLIEDLVLCEKEFKTE